MAFLQDKIYPKLPVFVQNLAISAYGWQWQKRRYGGIFEQELHGFKTREVYTTRQWQEYQTLQLRKVLIHAMETVPFYREHYGKSGITLSDVEKIELEGLLRLPYLEKEALRQYGETTLLSQKREPSGAFFSSSGSTGTPTKILFSHAMHQRWSAAYEARVRHWAGVDRFDARGMIGGRRVLAAGVAQAPYYRYNFIEKQAYFSAYHIAENTAPEYLKGIVKHRLKYMVGYAMSNYFLARFLHELKLEAPRLKAVLTSSEKLTPEMRSVFQSVYGCKTFDAWSGVEACALVSECEHGRLHISPDAGIVELLNAEGQPVKAGETGEVVCTGFLNFDQPLIRYRIGDLMRLGKDGCTCGRNMPVIEEIIGRIEDTVIGADGREMVRFHGIFVQLPQVIEGQIIQHDLTQFEIKVVATGLLGENEKQTIRNRMTSQLGPIDLKINEVPTIPRGANGKFKAVISHVKRPVSKV